MDEDNLNLEIRKFLKQVGISSQREIENYIRKKFSEGSIKTDAVSYTHLRAHET